MTQAGRGAAEGHGRIVGRYEILREIGRGGMAVVYVARQPDLDRQVALKELGAFHAGSAEFAHRFLRESRLAGSLNHPNIVTVHEYFEHEGTPYIAMEYVPRGSLRPYMKQLTLAQIGGVLEGVLAGLAHGETAGIVHRDLKPENIMVTADGRVKITDFGIARATERAGTQYMTATGMTVGTPTYMAPEQAMAGDIGPWTDLYSIGVLTYELVVGQVPFHGTEAPLVMLMRHVNEPIPSAIEVRPEVDVRLSNWIDALLVKDPLARTRHALAAWESFEEILIVRLGPRWRRDARLLDDQVAVQGSQPLTPAPFESRPMRTPTPPATTVPEEFLPFDPEAPEAAGDVVAGGAAGLAAAGADAAAPVGDAVTPEGETAAAAPAEEAEPPPAHVTQFITFGAGAAGVADASAAAAAAAPAGEVAAPGDVEPAAAEPAEPTAAEPQPASAGVEAAGVEAGGVTPAEVEPAEVDSDFVTYGRSLTPAPPEPVAEPAAETAAETEPVAEPEQVPDTRPLGEAEPELTLAPEAVVDPEPVTEPEPVVAGEPELTLAPEAVAEPEPVAEVEPEPAGTAPPERAAAVTAGRSRRGPIAILAAGVAVAAAAIGFLVAPTSKSGGSGPAALTQRAVAGPLTISYPSGWQRSASVPPGATSLRLVDSVTLNPGTSAPGGALVVGTSSGDGATLLPASFTAALASAPQGAPVKLGQNTFMRYFNVQSPGTTATETVYAMPTTAGTATAVCVEPTSNATTFAATCERAVSSLSARSGSVLPLNANPAYARGLSQIVTTLNAATVASERALAHASNRRGQSAAATAISAASSRAADQLGKLRPGPSAAAANAAIVSSLRSLASAYSSLAKAAAHNDGSAYSAARTAITNANAALGNAFAQLKQAGYTTG